MEQTFPSLHYFLRNAANNIKTPQSTFLLEKDKNEYNKITYAEVFEQLNAISAFLYSKGYQKGDKAALIIENCPEYIAFDQGLMQLGMINVSIYPSLSESEIEYILNDSEAVVILVGTPFLLKKINKIRANCPNLKYIITTFDDKKSDDVRKFSGHDVRNETELHQTKSHKGPEEQKGKLRAKVSQGREDEFFPAVRPVNDLDPRRGSFTDRIECVLRLC